MLHAETTGSRISGWYHHNRESSILNRDNDTFAAIHGAYFPKLVAFFMRRCDPALSEDLASVSLNLARQHWNRLSDSDKVESWLFAIARNLLKNHYRDRNRLKRKAEEVPLNGAALEALSPADNPEDILLTREQCAVVLRYIEDEMPARMRQCLRLKVVSELSYEEIARRLKIKVGTVKSQVSQARQTLKEHLGSQGLDRG